jgi:hypothetical protein
MPCAPEHPVLIHHREHVALALEAAEKEDGHAWLQNPPGSASYAGALYFKEMLRPFAEKNFSFIFDCGSDIGAFFAGLREGWAHFRLQAPPHAAARLRSIAAQRTAILHEPPHNTLNILDLHDQHTQLQRWFAH